VLRRISPQKWSISVSSGGAGSNSKRTSCSSASVGTSSGRNRFRCHRLDREFVADVADDPMLEATSAFANDVVQLVELVWLSRRSRHRGRQLRGDAACRR
jgi:hypothetical protein